MKRGLLLSGTFFALMMSGCTLYQKPKVPPVQIPCDFKVNVKASQVNLKHNWWENFHDAELNQLVCTAIKNNNNYRIAIKNIQIAKTYVDQAAAPLLPMFNLNYALSRNKISRNSQANFNSAGAASSNAQSGNSVIGGSGRGVIFNSEILNASVSYEVDIWNQIGNTVNQAKANVAVSDATSRVVKLTLISNVVATYYQIVALNANVTNLKQQYDVAVKIDKLVEDQYKGGLIDRSVVDDAKNQIDVIKNSISIAEKQRQIYINTMAYLLGEYPETLCYQFKKPLKRFEYTSLIPSGIPAQMVGNRPDIQAAYYQIISYGYLEKQNIANFLPSFSLTGLYGFSTSKISNLISPGSIYWNYGVNALQPLFDNGLRMAEYKRSKYQFEAAVLSYKDTLINAFSEVDSALSSYKEDYLALHSSENQLTNTRDKLKLANAQYHGGLTDYSTYLTTKLNYLQTDYNVINQQYMVLSDVVQVYKTLGLGL